MSEIEFPKLVDSSVITGIETLDNDFILSKERKTRLNLTINEGPDHQNTISCNVDYPNLVNLNYKLKSACNQIEEYIKTLALK
jgi:hypothetical protein